MNEKLSSQFSFNNKMNLTNVYSNWVFTLNNYTKKEYDAIQGLHPKTAKYIIMGKETGENGTPHLQGYIVFMTRKRFSYVKKRIGERAHIENAKGNHEQASDYCKKEGDYKEWGELPKNMAGKRTDLDNVKEAIKNGMGIQDLRENFTETMAKYEDFFLRYMEAFNPNLTIQYHDLRPWQQDLFTKIQLPADDRTINFVIDYKGNQGKTWFAKYCKDIMGEKVQIMKNGKMNDMAYIVRNDIKVLFIDCTRAMQEFMNYPFLEDVKNCMVQSTKYRAYMKYFPTNVHVIVLTNQEPDMTKLSADRYHLIKI